MKCAICGKEFLARRGASYCSSKCRKVGSRVPKSVTDVVTDIVTDVTVKDSWLCKMKGCNLNNMPGHGGQCIYHWRISENMPHISKEDYDKLNTPVSEDKCLTANPATPLPPVEDICGSANR